MLRQNHSSEKEIKHYLEIITCDPSLYLMDNPDLILSIFMESSIGLQRVMQSIWKYPLANPSIELLSKHHKIMRMDVSILQQWVNMDLNGGYKKELQSQCRVTLAEQI